MGSTDSNCCGNHKGEPKPETDSTRIKDINKGRPNNNNNNNDKYINTDPKQESMSIMSMSPNPSPQPMISSSSNEHLDTKTFGKGNNVEKRKKKKRKYNKVSTQIEILSSEKCRAQSLLLCSKPEQIKKDGCVKEFGFLKYLHTNLSENAVCELFSKFPQKYGKNKSQKENEQIKQNKSQNEENHSLSVSQFLSILTLTVIIYRVKLHQLRTGTKQKPSLNSENIKTSVEHLAIWCIRTKGDKQNDTKKIKVYDDNHNEIEGEFYVYKLKLTQTIFSQNIYKWIKEYVDKEGFYDFKQ